MLPLSRPQDLKADKAEAFEGWVPGWNPHLDIWHCMSALSRNQVRLAKAQARLTILWAIMSVLWMLTSATLTWGQFHG